ncbi:tRNA-queuosine alpha-mannosyltransferase-like [Ornithodoros turicata]|uniref:tRNA-queuosine alpha-mannosyltransferase-like n=1 Tax=Ornithodoros turicata TaxID=34597 RepID=UPI003139CC09
MSVLLIEPFYSGSHKQLVDLLASELGDEAKLITMSGVKWHWRARTSAVWLAEAIPENETYKVLLASSVLNLAELVSLRPDIARLHKVLYFHENQLVYPVRKQQDRDFQYGYNQIISCLVADKVLFNSKYNMHSFLGEITHFLKLMPDYRPKGLEEKIRNKSSVLYFPLDLPPDVAGVVGNEATCLDQMSTSDVLHIVWPHRWEHDKGPEDFFAALVQLHSEGLQFKVSVLGQEFSEIPGVFTTARAKLEGHIFAWGHQENKADYYKILSTADVAVSTAHHEFFGVAMLEATLYGCYPLCPKRLVYPEIFPEECLYNTQNQLVKRLRNFCHNPQVPRRCRPKIDNSMYTWKTLRAAYRRILLLPS